MTHFRCRVWRVELAASDDLPLFAMAEVRVGKKNRSDDVTGIVASLQHAVKCLKERLRANSPRIPVQKRVVHLLTNSAEYFLEKNDFFLL